MKTKKSATFWAALVIFSLTGQIAWVVENMYLNVFLYEMFNASASQISLMVGASAVTATVTTLLIGALSDKWGKRRLFIVGGYILWGLSILAFAAVKLELISALFPAAASASAIAITIVIALDCVMTFFGSSANDACFNAWLTDNTDSTNRGAAEGINSMMPLMAVLVVFGGFMSFDLSSSSDWTAIFFIIGGVVLLIGVAGLFLIRESTEKTSENERYFANIFYGFRPKVIAKNPVLYLCLVAFALFGIAIQIFMPYLILYYTVTLQMDNYVLIMAPAIILAAIATAFYGRVYDKKGFRVAVIPPLAVMAAGFVVLSLFRSTPLVFIGSLLMMTGDLCGMAIFGAVIRDYTPKGKAGMFQGLRIVAQVLIPGIIGPAIGAAVLQNADTVVNNDGTTSFVPNENIYLAALCVCALLALFLPVVFRAIKKTRAKENDHVK